GFLFTTHVTPEPPPAAATTSPSTAAAAAPPASSTAKPDVRQTDQAPSGNTEVLRNTAPASTAVQPAAVPVVADKQQTELYPPFTGTWLITSVGETRDGTAQRNIMQQQYSCEFSGTDASGTRYKNDGKSNEDYFGYGKDILAPANGTVVEVIDGIRENSPGIRNPYAQIGNAIVIQHSSKEFSVLAFLKQGSIRVKAGEKVTRGQLLAQCGISGNATEPVLHYHLQDSPYLQTAKRIKFYFERAMITNEGKKQLHSVYLPAAGEMISPE
ncbi:MAG: M23 family metallopeptidase, partial [Ignavibacteriae bacterium]